MQLQLFGFVLHVNVYKLIIWILRITEHFIDDNATSPM